MLALTIRQPWAWAIVAGFKTVENRRWKTAVRGRIYVHAGRLDDAPALDSFRCICERLHIAPPPLETLATRAIIGSVEIVDCLLVEIVNTDPWASGPWCFVLRDPYSREPIPVRAFPAFWNSELWNINGLGICERDAGLPKEDDASVVSSRKNIPGRKPDTYDR